MAWMRTREIKPGVYETQSAGFHLAVQIGIALAVLVGGVALISALFSGNPGTALAWLIPIGLIAGLHFSHHQDQKAKGAAAQKRNPGPWSAADRTPTLDEVIAESERLRAEANRKS